MSEEHPSPAEGDRRDAETNRIAAEGNRMSAEDARVVTDKGRTKAAAGRAVQRRRRNLAQVGAYFLIVAVGMFAFNQSDKNQDALCETQITNRAAIRGLVVAIEELGSGLVVTGPPDGKTQMMLDQLQQFKTSQLEVLEGEGC